MASVQGAVTAGTKEIFREEKRKEAEVMPSWHAFFLQMLKDMTARFASQEKKKSNPKFSQATVFSKYT